MSSRTCPKGHTVSDPDAKYCPECGAHLAMPEAQTGPTEASNSARKRDDSRSEWLVAISGCLVVILCVAVFSFDSLASIGTAARPPHTPTLAVKLWPTRTPGPSATPRPTARASFSYSQVCWPDSRMTSPQVSEHLGYYNGRRFWDWTGWVYDVTVQNRGLRTEAYVVQVEIETPGERLGLPTIEVYGLGKATAMDFRKGDKVQFSGYIRAIHSAYGVHCMPLEVRVIESEFAVTSR